MKLDNTESVRKYRVKQCYNILWNYTRSPTAAKSKCIPHIEENEPFVPLWDLFCKYSAKS